MCYGILFGCIMRGVRSSSQSDPDNKVHGANMGPTWVLSAPDGPHVGPRNLAFRDGYDEGHEWPVDNIIILSYHNKDVLTLHGSFLSKGPINNQHCLKKWSDAEEATSHYLNQWWCLRRYIYGYLSYSSQKTRGVWIVPAYAKLWLSTIWRLWVTRVVSTRSLFRSAKIS